MLNILEINSSDKVVQKDHVTEMFRGIL